MRFRIYLPFLFVLLLSIDTTLGDHNKTKSITDGVAKLNLKDKSNNYRNKRSFDGDEMPFWPNRGRRLAILDNRLKLESNLGRNEKNPNNDVMDKEPPFWGTRGRRDSSSVENDIEDGSMASDDTMLYGTNCKQCYTDRQLKESYGNNGYLKDRREEHEVPFWGNRGRRNSAEADDDNHLSWKTRDMRQEDDPFWGTRGRRDDEVPFWGNRGRRYSWGKEDVKNPPFWGNRGRRNEVEPFWGSRGRRQESEPFWGSRGRRENQNRQMEVLKKVLHDAVNTVEDNIESLTRTRREGSHVSNSFWGSRGRDSKLSNLFTLGHHRFQTQRLLENGNLPQSNTIHDDRMYADQPHYILVDRTSRSSAEDDPYYITRGKKMFINYDYPYSTRSRRGSIEEIVKSVRNDPYYIVRGKKNAPDNLIGNRTIPPKDLRKAKELICSTIDLILNNNGNKTKRDLEDNDRDRRTILKKLAAQLQMDPYFVSRGKKNESGINEHNLEDFINEISVKCN